MPEIHGIDFLLPLFLVQRLYFFFLVVYLIFVLDGDIDSIVVVYSIGLFLHFVHQFHLASVVSLLLSQRNLKPIQWVYLIEISPVLDRLHSLIIKRPLIHWHVCHALYLDVSFFFCVQVVIFIFFGLPRLLSHLSSVDQLDIRLFTVKVFEICLLVELGLFAQLFVSEPLVTERIYRVEKVIRKFIMLISIELRGLLFFLVILFQITNLLIVFLKQKVSLSIGDLP